jgi:transcriptional regulator with XRE-family HTH domain
MFIGNTHRFEVRRVVMTSDEVKLARKGLGLTQGGLASALGISISTVQRWEYDVTKVRKVYELAIGSLTLWAEYVGKKGDGAFDIPSKAEMKRQVITLQDENEKLRRENERLTHRVAALANTIAKWVCTPTRELKKLIVGREEGIVGVIKDWLRDGELTL